MAALAAVIRLARAEARCLDAVVRFRPTAGSDIVGIAALAAVTNAVPGCMNCEGEGKS